MASNRTHRTRRTLLSIAHAFGLFIAMTIICCRAFGSCCHSLRPTVEIMAKPPVWIPQDLSLDAYMPCSAGRAGRHSGLVTISATR